MSEDESSEDFSCKIENVVATVTLDVSKIENEKLDLMLIARKFSDVEYNPERFPGLIMRITEPRGTILLFSTGKMVITGLTSSENSVPVVKQALDRLKKCGISLEMPAIEIQNIVASGNLNCMIDLNMGAIVLENSMYEPEVFPGLIYRMKDPKAVFLIFSTGKVVCTGARNKEIVEESTRILYDLIRDRGLAKEEEDFEFDEDPLEFL
jgi:transcription initiation factor TFIID TATA-box-binding protein